MSRRSATGRAASGRRRSAIGHRRQRGAPGVALAAAAVAEALEARRLLTAITWTGGNGNWNVGGSWSTGQVPGPSDDAIIPAGVTVSVTDGEAPNTITAAAGSPIDITATRTLTARTGGTISGAVNDAGLFYGSGTSTAPLSTTRGRSRSAGPATSPRGTRRRS
jgi:hypothetical protein